MCLRDHHYEEGGVQGLLERIPFLTLLQDDDWLRYYGKDCIDGIQYGFLDIFVSSYQSTDIDVGVTGGTLYKVEIVNRDVVSLEYVALLLLSLLHLPATLSLYFQ